MFPPSLIIFSVIVNNAKINGSDNWNNLVSRQDKGILFREAGDVYLYTSHHSFIITFSYSLA